MEIDWVESRVYEGIHVVCKLVLGEQNNYSNQSLQNYFELLNYLIFLVIWRQNRSTDNEDHLSEIDNHYLPVECIVIQSYVEKAVQFEIHILSQLRLAPFYSPENDYREDKCP